MCDGNKKSYWSELQNCGARDLFSHNKSVTSFLSRSSQCQPKHVHFLFAQKTPKAYLLLSVIQLKNNRTTVLGSDCVVPASSASSRGSVSSAQRLCGAGYEPHTAGPAQEQQRKNCITQERDGGAPWGRCE